MAIEIPGHCGFHNNKRTDKNKAKKTKESTTRIQILQREYGRVETCLRQFTNRSQRRETQKLGIICDMWCM